MQLSHSPLPRLRPGILMQMLGTISYANTGDNLLCAQRADLLITYLGAGRHKAHILREQNNACNFASYSKSLMRGALFWNNAQSREIRCASSFYRISKGGYTELRLIVTHRNTNTKGEIGEEKNVSSFLFFSIIIQFSYLPLVTYLYKLE